MEGPRKSKLRVGRGSMYFRGKRRSARGLSQSTLEAKLRKYYNSGILESEIVS